MVVGYAIGIFSPNYKIHIILYISSYTLKTKFLDWHLNTFVIMLYIIMFIYMNVFLFVSTKTSTNAGLHCHVSTHYYGTSNSSLLHLTLYLHIIILKLYCTFIIGTLQYSVYRGTYNTALAEVGMY